jgi:hypothetical protein
MSIAKAGPRPGRDRVFSTCDGVFYEILDDDQDVIVFFDMRGRDGVFHEILDDDQNVIAALSYADFLGAYKAQQGVA